MDSELYEYGGGFILALSEAQRDQVKSLCNINHCSSFVNVGESGVYIHYSGRDSARHIRRFMVELASLLGEAEGEVVVSIEPLDGGDPIYEFYTVSGGKLFVELGEILRKGRRPAGTQ